MSTPSTKFGPWHGIARETIPWFPVNHDKCIGCELCFVTCGRGVYDVHDHKAWPERQYDCMVGCTTCANICPAQAITFPDKQIVQKVEREHKILAIVRKEAIAKHAKLDAEKARARAEDAVAGKRPGQPYRLPPRGRVWRETFPREAGGTIVRIARSTW